MYVNFVGSIAPQFLPFFDSTKSSFWWLALQQYLLVRWRAPQTCHFLQSQRRITRSSHHALSAKYIINDNPPTKAHLQHWRCQCEAHSAWFFLTKWSCIESDIKVEHRARDLPFLTYKMLLAHIRFPNKLEECWLILVPDSKEIRSKLQSIPSPAVAEVKSSGIITVSQVMWRLRHAPSFLFSHLYSQLEDEKKKGSC